MSLDMRELGDLLPEFPINSVHVGKAVANCRLRQLEIIFLAQGPDRRGGDVIRAVRVSWVIVRNDVIRNLDLNIASRFRRNPNFDVIFSEFRLAGKRITLFDFFAAQLADDFSG